MMKYWNQLNELETAIYEVKTIQAGLNILCQTEEFTCYSPSGISQEHQTFVIDLNDRFDTAMEKLNERFQEVWNVVRDDTGFLGAAEEDDEEFTNEDIAAINDLVKDQEASIRFDQILSNLPTMNTQDNYIVAGAMEIIGISRYSIPFRDVTKVFVCRRSYHNRFTKQLTFFTRILCPCTRFQIGRFTAFAHKVIRYHAKLKACPTT